MADRTVTVGSGKTYSTPALAVAGESDFADGEDNIVFVIDAGVYYTPVSITSGYTTSLSHRVILTHAEGAFHNFQRNTGVRINYQQEIWWTNKITIQIPYVTIDGLAVGGGYSTGGNGIRSNGDYCVIINCLAHDCYYGLRYDVSPNSVVINSAAYSCMTGFFYGDSSRQVAYNCIALNCTEYGFSFQTWWALNYLKNCYAGGCGTYDIFIQPGTVDISNSYTSDGSQGTTVISLADCEFYNSTTGSEDVSIGSDSDLIDVGTDLSEDSIYPFDTDGYGNSRGEDWDVGVMEYVSAGSSYVVSIMQAMNHFNGGM